MLATSNGGVPRTLRPTLFPTSDAELARRLVRRFDAAVATPEESVIAAVEEAARDLGTAMRATSLAPEHAVVALKTLLCRHSASHWYPSLAVHVFTRLRAEHVVYERLFVAWLHAYFGTQAAA